MKFQNFIVLEFAKQPIRRFKIYKRQSQRVSVVLYLASRKVIKFSGTRDATKCHKTGAKSTSAASKMSAKYRKA
ncbi:hypothetical protein [uncultured Campylobacter sp.]|uniref:hypothetical protein n=1 Tax=uncultured Campylobacter sp. TaxID=218934 RepID=UPI0026074127|nr:hypothetical protein [uncultured Campylobacter sp.]